MLSGRGSADRYVVLGAQRDAWGKGYTKATVGTSVLFELAKAVREMVEKGNKCSAVRIYAMMRHHVGGMETQRLLFNNIDLEKKHLLSLRTKKLMTFSLSSTVAVCSSSSNIV